MNIPIETSVNQATGAPNDLGGDSTQSFLNRLVRPDSGQSVLITIASSILAIIIALLIAGVILLITGKNPLEAYSKMLNAGLTPVKLVEAMQRATPLILAAVAVAIGFKMNLFNIGVEGQYLIGLSDNIVVMFDGRINARLTPADATPELLGTYMTGGLQEIAS